MQILTEKPTEDGQYVVLWGTEKLWCNQIRVIDGALYGRKNNDISADTESNWIPLTYTAAHDNTWPKTFLKL